VAWTVHWSAPLTQSSVWVGQHENVFLIGPNGDREEFSGLCALAEKTCHDGYTAFYTRASQLFRDLNLARADGSLLQLAKMGTVVVDDWAMAPVNDIERRDRVANRVRGGGNTRGSNSHSTRFFREFELGHYPTNMNVGLRGLPC
jgi:hypothetical protein